MLLGFDQVRDLALSLNVIAAIEPPGVSAFSTREYWKHAFMAGSLARGFCRPFWRVYPGSTTLPASCTTSAGSCSIWPIRPPCARWSPA